MSEKEGNEARVAVLETLAGVSERFPNLRICQLIANATAVHDPYYWTDAQVQDALMAYLERHSAAPRKRRNK